MWLSIVIAVYNEESNIKELTERLFASMKKLKIPFEVIYAIDGKDNSAKIAKQLQKTRKNLLVDASSEKRGFRNAFVKGFSMVNKKATHILTMDADLNHQPEEMGNLIKNMERNNADVVIGSRYINQGKVEKLALWKRGISLIANVMIKIVWGIKLKDKTSGYRLYKKEVIQSIIPRCKSKNFEFLMEMIIVSVRSKYKLTEEPINFIARQHGESKFRLVETAKGYFKLMFRRY